MNAESGQRAVAAGASASAGAAPVLAVQAADEKRRLAILLLAIVLGGTLLGIVYHLILHYGLGWQYPWSTYMFRPAARFSDFLTDWVTVRSYGLSQPQAPTQMSGYYYAVPEPYVLAYSPAAHLLMRGIAVLPPIWGLTLEIAALLTTVLFASYLCMREAFASAWGRWVAAMAFAFASYPVAFVADRGNFDMVVFAIVFWGVYLYAKGSWRWAMALLGVAAALKYYPAILLLLPVIDRRYRAAIWGAVVALATTVAATVALGFMTPGISPFGVARYAWQTLTGVHGGYTTWGFEGITHRHSIWSVFHLVWIRVAGADPSTSVSLAYVLVAALVVAGVVVWLLLVAGPEGRRVALWRKAGILIVMMILLPPLSSDYTLLYVFIPLSLMLTAPELPASGKVAAVLLALCFVPMDYLFIEPWFKGNATIEPALGDTKSSVITYACLLLGAGVAMMLARAPRQVGQ